MVKCVKLRAWCGGVLGLEDRAGDVGLKTVRGLPVRVAVGGVAG